MSIQIQGRLYRLVSEVLLDDFGVHIAAEEQRRSRVAQVVESGSTEFLRPLQDDENLRRSNQRPAPENDLRDFRLVVRGRIGLFYDSAKHLDEQRAFFGSERIEEQVVHAIGARRNHRKQRLTGRR
jgi:hypothetical protein